MHLIVSLLLRIETDGWIDYFKKLKILVTYHYVY